MNVVTIAEKQERVEDAIKQIKITTGVDKKVSEYFQKTLTKLQHGINVPLPDFFHATRTGLENIIQTKTIRQSTMGAAGQAPICPVITKDTLAMGLMRLLLMRAFW